MLGAEFPRLAQPSFRIVDLCIFIGNSRHIVIGVQAVVYTGIRIIFGSDVTSLAIEFGDVCYEIYRVLFTCHLSSELL